MPCALSPLAHVVLDALRPAEDRALETKVPPGVVAPVLAELVSAWRAVQVARRSFRAR